MVGLIKNCRCNHLTAHCHYKGSLVPPVGQQVQWYTHQLLAQCLAGQMKSGILLFQPTPNGKVVSFLGSLILCEETGNETSYHNCIYMVCQIHCSYTMNMEWGMSTYSSVNFQRMLWLLVPQNEYLLQRWHKTKHSYPQNAHNSPVGLCHRTHCTCPGLTSGLCRLDYECSPSTPETLAYIDPQASLAGLMGP